MPLNEVKKYENNSVSVRMFSIIGRFNQSIHLISQLSVITLTQKSKKLQISNLKRDTVKIYNGTENNEERY